MPREPKWTNETTERVAHGLLKLCQPAAEPSDQEPIDWPQVIKLLRAVQNGGAGEESRRFNLAAHMSAVL
jgi:hypothetical protein